MECVGVSQNGLVGDIHIGVAACKANSVLCFNAAQELPRNASVIDCRFRAECPNVAFQQLLFGIFAINCLELAKQAIPLELHAASSLSITIDWPAVSRPVPAQCIWPVLFKDLAKEAELTWENAIIVSDVDHIIAFAMLQSEFEILTHRDAFAGIEILQSWVLDGVDDLPCVVIASIVANDKLELIVLDL
jgi:hypothetical protein